MTREDQHTELNSLHAVTGKSANWAALAQKALNYLQVLGSMSQKPKPEPGKSLFSNGFFLAQCFK